MPSPKKLREDSVKIALATPKLAATMTGPRMLGRMCCTAIKTLPAPRFLDATTKSLSFKDIVSARVIRATDAHENRLSTKIRVVMPGLRMVLRTIISNILGSARKISVKRISSISSLPPM